VSRGNPAHISMRNRLLEDPGFTKQEWLDLLREHGYSCAYCGKTGIKLTKDHVIPLSKGGTHTKENILPCCPDCNHEKNDRTLEEWREDREIAEWEREHAPIHSSNAASTSGNE
jgi:5-methylcytosine-specific restriction endonuclease McrA